tara:strand:+ start:1233 stop:2678 length:1446 start_codon:yes stop_codon:yes gene_type:complete
MSSAILRFIYNNNIFEINNPNPNETLLNFIRNDLKKNGTKEGCAEGGCGACTVVLGSLEKNTIKYQSINACIVFLPTIHNKQLILIEDLQENKNTLHPVQESMLNFHGSQCGFCTPGFIMSLFAMYKNNYTYSEKIIKDSIAGNLCRCTGYKPIMESAKSLNNKSKYDKFSKKQNIIINLLKKIKKKDKTLIINNNNNKYYAPKKIIELKNLLKKYPNSRILSGGTDLSLEITKLRKTLNSIIYIGEINELNFIKKNDRYIEIGSCTPLIIFEKYIEKIFPDFYEILQRYGSTQIRNTATIGGNIATASPIGDTLPILLSLNAKIKIVDYKKELIMPLKEFFLGYRKTKLNNNQFIKSIIIPIENRRIIKSYKISKRIDDDISSVCGAFNLKIKNNIISSILIAFGGMSVIPKRAINCEKFLTNNEFSKNSIINAQQILEKDFSPIDDMRASSRYRMEIAKNLLLKLYLEIKNKQNIRINE